MKSRCLCRLLIVLTSIALVVNITMLSFKLYTDTELRPPWSLLEFVETSMIMANTASSRRSKDNTERLDLSPRQDHFGVNAEDKFQGKYNNFVAIPTTLGIFAREEDYDYLAPLVARNWLLFGFRPIVIVVASKQDIITEVRNIWDAVMPKEALVIPILAPPEAAISVAQLSRLYAATLLPIIPGDAYLRITDGDMMVHDEKPFLPPTSKADINIFNGKIGLKKNNEVGGNRTCRQYPMHSVGMSFTLWRKLFPMKDPSNVLTSISSVKKQFFPHLRNITTNMLRGLRSSKEWYMDQVLLGCTIDDAKESGYTVELTRGSGAARRIHPGQSLEKIPITIDIHLTNFALGKSNMTSWMDQLVDESKILTGYQSEYVEYTKAWVRYRSIELGGT